MPKPFLIAEAGINHDGDFDRALKLVDIAADSSRICEISIIFI